jgi:hypothetical protein
MNNTQTQVSAANTSTPSAANSGSHLISVQDPAGGGYFMHVEELKQFMNAAISSNREDAMKLDAEARKRYEFLEAMLPATPLTPENLAELFADLDDCKTLMNVLPPDVYAALAGNSVGQSMDPENLKRLDAEGRKHITNILTKFGQKGQHSHNILPL